MARLIDSGSELEQLTGQATGKAEALQSTPKIGLLRLAALQLAPGKRTELDFQQLAQASQLKTHGIEQAWIDRR